MRYHFRILNLYIYTGAVLFNSTHHTLICVECGCGVNHRDVHIHFLVYHKASNSSASQSHLFLEAKCADGTHHVIHVRELETHLFTLSPELPGAEQGTLEAFTSPST